MSTLTAADLKYYHEEAFPNSLFFSRNNMKFAGDTMRNFRVVNAYGMYDGERIELYCLQQRQPVKGVNKGCFYFRKRDFKRLHDVSDVIIF